MKLNRMAVNLGVKWGPLRREFFDETDPILGNGIVTQAPKISVDDFLRGFQSASYKGSEAKHNITLYKESILKLESDFAAFMKSDQPPDEKQKYEESYRTQKDLAEKNLKNSETTLRNFEDEFEMLRDQFFATYTPFLQEFSKKGLSQFTRRYFDPDQRDQIREEIKKATKDSEKFMETKSYRNVVFLLTGNPKELRNKLEQKKNEVNMSDPDVYTQEFLNYVISDVVRKEMWERKFGPNIMESTRERWGEAEWGVWRPKDKEAWRLLIGQMFKNTSDIFYNNLIHDGLSNLNDGDSVSMEVDASVVELLLNKGIDALKGTRSFMNAKSKLTDPFSIELQTYIVFHLMAGKKLHKAHWIYDKESNSFKVTFYDKNNKEVADIPSISAEVPDLAVVKKKVEMLSSAEEDRLLGGIATRLVEEMLRKKTLPRNFRLDLSAEQGEFEPGRFYNVRGKGTHFDTIEDVRAAVAKYISDFEMRDEKDWQARSIPFIVDSLRGIAMAMAKIEASNPLRVGDYPYPTDIPKELLEPLLEMWRSSGGKMQQSDYSKVLTILEKDVRLDISANAELIKQIALLLQKKYRESRSNGNEGSAAPIVTSDEILNLVKLWDRRNQILELEKVAFSEAVKEKVQKFTISKRQILEMKKNLIAKLKARILRFKGLKVTDTGKVENSTVAIDLRGADSSDRVLREKDLLDLPPGTMPPPRQSPYLQTKENWLENPPKVPRPPMSKSELRKVKFFWLKVSRKYFGKLFKLQRAANTELDESRQ